MRRRLPFIRFCSPGCHLEGKAIAGGSTGRYSEGSMRSFSAICIAILLPAAPSQGVDYLRDIKPIFKERCYACHGALKQESGLRVDTAAAIRLGGDSGPAV